MRTHHFCNVFRIDDRTSKAVSHLMQRWSDPWRGALVGRLINKPSTLSLASQLENPTTGKFRDLVYKGINTNAYRFNTPLGLNNREGLVEIYRQAEGLGEEVLRHKSIPSVLSMLRKTVPTLGGFVGYQVLLDLVENSMFLPDFVDDWAWLGPGCLRGVFTLMGEDQSADWSTRFRYWPNRQEAATANAVMLQLLEQSRDPACWPWQDKPWTIHEVEGWLCEYDKWARRTYSGDLKAGRKYKGPFS